MVHPVGGPAPLPGKTYYQAGCFGRFRRVRSGLCAAIFVLPVLWGPLTGCLGPGNDPITPQKEYTAETPGEWESVAYAHVPSVHIGENPDGRKTLRVGVPNLKREEGHYIERIGVMDAGQRDIEARSLSRTEFPGAVLPVDPHILYSEGIKIYVKCNLHDLWTVEMEKVMAAEGGYPDPDTAKRLEENRAK